MKSHIGLYIALAIVLAVLTYSNTLNGEFQFDDDAVVLRNPYVKDMPQLSRLNFLQVIMGGGRPVTLFTFALTYKMSGFDVRWYHGANLLIHLMNGILLFYFVLLTMNSPRLAGLNRNDASPVAVLSMAVFLLHPIQTGAVNYISQRSELLVSLFYLLSLIMYVMARSVNRGTPSLTHSEFRSRRIKSGFFYLGAVISYLLAMGSKEIAVTIPIMALIYDFYFLRETPVLKRIAGPGIFILLSVIGGLFILKDLGKGVTAGFSLKTFTPWEYLMTQFRALTAYIGLLFLPINQNVDYDFRISKSLFEATTALSFLFILILIFAAIASFKRWRTGSFFILWFFIILSPTSSIIPILDPFFEHRVYLACAGIFIAVIDGFFRFGAYDLIRERFPRRAFSVLLSSTIALLLILSASTYQRNKVWQTNLSLWEDAARKSPFKARVHNNLGNCYMSLGRYLEAAEEYKKAVTIEKNDLGIYFNLALSLDKAGFPEQALYYYELFSHLAPDSLREPKENVSARIEAIKRMRPGSK